MAPTRAKIIYIEKSERNMTSVSIIDTMMYLHHVGMSIIQRMRNVK